MSLELETLDQLAGGDMRLAIIRRLYPNDTAFWRWRELFKEGGVLSQLDTLTLALTDQGAKKI